MRPDRVRLFGGDLSTMGLLTIADYGTTCGADARTMFTVDAGFAYTLTATRDVTIDASATGAVRV